MICLASMFIKLFLMLHNTFKGVPFQKPSRNASLWSEVGKKRMKCHVGLWSIVVHKFIDGLYIMITLV